MNENLARLAVAMLGLVLISVGAHGWLPEWVGRLALLLAGVCYGIFWERTKVSLADPERQG